MPVRLNIFVLLVFILSIVGSSCLKSKKPGIPDKVLETLGRSNIHKPGYMRMILSFQAPEDSLKLQAAYFILNNLENNYSISHSLVDSLDNEIIINADDFSDIYSIKKYRDSIEIKVGKLHYKTDTICMDFNNIIPDSLTKHIADSYKTWTNNRSSNYSFDIYCNYILPYRTANENVENYLTFFQAKYGHIIDSSHTIKETALQLSDEINTELIYDIRLEINPVCQTIRKTDSLKRGNLLDLNNYKIKALRSFGIAAVLDYTPSFADTILGYYSTTVILPNDKKIRLKNPDNNESPYGNNNVAKVYRRSYNEVADCLFSIKDKSIHTPSFIGNYNYLDVSNEYIITSDTSIIFSDTNNYGYLAIWNDEILTPIDWSAIDSVGLANFSNLGIGITYTPVIVYNKEVIPVGESFVLGR